MLKKRLLLSLLTLFGIVFLLAACGDDSESSTTLTLAEDESEDFPTTKGDEKFAELVEEQTDGRYKIDVQAGGQLGDEKDVIEQVQLGTIDLARVNGVPLTEFNDNIGVFNLPFLFDSDEDKWEIWDGDVGEEILDSFLENDMIGLAYYDNGERFFYNNDHPVEELEDMEGLKIRVQESELAIDTVEALGASATPMDYSEVYNSLQTGVIDGAENNMASFYDVSHHEVADYVSLPGYQTVPEVVIGSKKLWDDLDEEDQKIFKEAAKESEKTEKEEWDKLEDESEEKVKEHGNEITEVKDIDKWEEAVQPVYDKHGDQYQEWLDEIEEELSE